MGVQIHNIRARALKFCMQASFTNEVCTQNFKALARILWICTLILIFSYFWLVNSICSQTKGQILISITEMDSLRSTTCMKRFNILPKMHAEFEGSSSNIVDLHPHPYFELFVADQLDLRSNESSNSNLDCRNGFLGKKHGKIKNVTVKDMAKSEICHRTWQNQEFFTELGKIRNFSVKTWQNQEYYHKRHGKIKKSEIYCKNMAKSRMLPQKTWQKQEFDCKRYGYIRNFCIKTWQNQECYHKRYGKIKKLTAKNMKKSGIFHRTLQNQEQELRNKAKLRIS